MSFKRISLIILILACTKTLWPCDCYWFGPFLHTAKNAKLVVRAKVLKYFAFKVDNYGHKAMDIEIMETYKGQEVKKTIRVWGGDGGRCKPIVEQFTIGNTYILALFKGKEEYEENDYTTYICGEYWLEVKKQIVIGHITNKDLGMNRQRMKLAYFNGLLRGVLNRESIRVNG